MQFDTTPKFDGVWYWWPKGVTVSQHIAAYIEAFKTRDYEIFESFELEPDYIKIALYIKNNTENCSQCSTAKINGIWMSKLGSLHDIEHGTPYSIEGTNYGRVYCFRKTKK